MRRTRRPAAVPSTEWPWPAPDFFARGPHGCGSGPAQLRHSISPRAAETPQLRGGDLGPPSPPCRSPPPPAKKNQMQPLSKPRRRIFGLKNNNNKNNKTKKVRTRSEISHRNGLIGVNYSSSSERLRAAHRPA